MYRPFFERRIIMRENIKWSKIIEENRDRLVEAGMEAYHKALYNHDRKYEIRLDEDGEIDVADLPESSNGISMAMYEGWQICVYTINFMYDDTNEPTDDDIINQMEKIFSEKEIKEVIDNFENALDENWFFTLEQYINEDIEKEPRLSLLKACVKHAYEGNLEADYDNFAYDFCDFEVDLKLDMYREMERN